MLFLLSITIMIVFLVGFEFGRLYGQLKASIMAIRETMNQKPVEAAKAIEREPGVVVAKKPSEYAEPVDLSAESGGVLPMSPRAVAMEEARRDR